MHKGTALFFDDNSAKCLFSSTFVSFSALRLGAYGGANCREK